MKRRTVFLAAGALAAPLVACQFLAGIEERGVAGLDATTSDAAPDALRDAGREGAPAGDAQAERASYCLGAQPPPPPRSTSPTGMSGDFYVAVESIWYDPSATTDAGLTLGYNLDHTCTCEGKPKGPPSCVNDAMPNCDGDAGRDLAGNDLLLMVDSFISSTVAAVFNSKIASGQVTAIIHVDHYNLGMDDPAVTLSSFVSGGLYPPDAGPDAGTISPKWDGTDSWSVDPHSTSAVGVVDGGYVYTPIFVDTEAYVTNHTLVSNLSQLQLGLGAADLSLTDAVLVASVEPDGTTGGYTLTGQIAGRISLSTLFHIASTFGDPTTPDASQGYCGSDVVFQTLIRPSLCNAADIMSAKSKDDTGQGCDALSLGIGFVAHRVLLGSPVVGISPVLGCDGSVASCSGL